MVVSLELDYLFILPDVGTTKQEIPKAIKSKVIVKYSEAIQTDDDQCHCPRQKKVYIADEHKKRVKDDYDPDLDHFYNIYLRNKAYLCTLRSYSY